MMATEHGGQMIGECIGNYRLVHLLGRGGFADVYQGEHLYLGSYAAIKVLQTPLTHDLLEQFRQEARILACLHHPHIVSVLDFDVQNGVPFLAMSYASGGTLRQRHPKGSCVPLHTVVEYVEQVASALDYAHGQKLIHRDVKPENMLLDQHGRIVLSDFGVASILHNTRSQTMEAFAGTLAYVAPEQIQGRPRTASDQYALAVVVYEWLSGERPFQGSVSEVISQHLMTPPQPLSGRIPALPSVVEKVIFTALAKDPHERYASVQDFATALVQASMASGTTVVDEDTSSLSILEEEQCSAHANQSSGAEAVGTAYPQKSGPSVSSIETADPASPLIPPSSPMVVVPSHQLAVEGSMGMSMLPSWARSMQQKPRRQLFLVVRTVLLVALLVTGGIVVVFARSARSDKITSIPATPVRSEVIVQAQVTSNVTATAPMTLTSPSPTIVLTSEVGVTPTVTVPRPKLTPTSTPTPTPTPKPACPPTIEYGNTGSWVKVLQRDLNARGIKDQDGEALVVDGAFGPRTRYAVESWQKHAHIQVDGIVGPITWHTLNEC